MAEKKTKGRRIYRDVGTGRFVTKKYAKKHPKRVVKERRVDTRSTQPVHPARS